MYEKLYPGISNTFRAFAKKYPPKTDNFQSIEFHEEKLKTFLLKGFEDGTITPVEKKAEGVKPVQEPSTKAEQLKPELAKKFDERIKKGEFKGYNPSRILSERKQSVEQDAKRLADNEAREKFAPAESKPTSTDQIKPTGK